MAAVLINSEDAERGASSRQLHSLRLLYTLSGLSFTTWGRFATIYYNNRGMTGAQIGLVEATMPLVVAMFNPMWGCIADITGSKKRVYLSTFVCGSAILCLLAFNQIAVNFLAIWLLSLATSVFRSSGVLDAYVLEVCGKDGKKMYGRLRLWQAAGWGGGAFVMSLVAEHYGFMWVFVAYATCAVLNATAVAVLVSPHTRDEEERRESRQAEEVAGPRFGELFAVLCTPSVVLFLVEVWIAGCCLGVVERLLFVYVERDLGGSMTLCGLVVLITVIPELPIFFYAERILNAVGIRGCLTLSYAAYAARVGGYTLLHTDTRYWLLALEVLHGPTFALLWIAAVERARLLSAQHCPEWSATVQSLLSMVYESLGMGCGTLAGGLVYDYYGPRVMYRGAAGVMAVLCVLRCAVMAATKRERHERLLAESPRCSDAATSPASWRGSVVH
eukprot:TRINITY_DN5608_c1_g1_i1.p1 TRINITY_DN5608_c1_g1~~TRINITY_DN5608_c1_g1_i1.p1  ORF type:complete len:468 (+),score=97.61 TRINITY_DN5608_c1_g1_i1:71-1405(+)